MTNSGRTSISGKNIPKPKLITKFKERLWPKDLELDPDFESKDTPVDCFCANFKTCKHAQLTDKKPIWEESFSEKFWYLGQYVLDGMKGEEQDGRDEYTKLVEFIKEVETAAYERGKAETPSCCYKECHKHEMVRIYNTVSKL